MKGSFGREIASVTANSESGEPLGNSAPYKNLSHRKNTFRELNLTTETRWYNPDEVS